MSDTEENVDLASKICMVEALRTRCQRVMHEAVELQKRDGFEGLYRYTNALNAEIGFLDKLLEEPARIKKKYIQSSNLSYLEAVHEAMASTGNIKELMQLMSVPPTDNGVWMPRAAQMRNRSVKVDVIAENGLVWIKVIARNAKGLRFDMAGLELEDQDDDDEYFSSDDDEEFEGGNEMIKDGAVVGGFDQLPIFKKAREYLASAAAHQVHFRTPLVVFAFMRLDNEDPLIARIMNQLRDMGILVHTSASSSASLQEVYRRDLGPCTSLITPALNLDVSTVLALISEMAHNACEPSEVDGEALQIQAEREREAPALPVLKAIVEGKDLCMVQSAYDRLESIVNIVGGRREQARFRFLFRKDSAFDQALWTLLPPLEIRVVPDSPSERFRRLLEPPARKGKLNNGRKIRTRFSEFHAVIFGSGDSYRMTTVTAIQWMETALVDAGLTSVSIVSHEPRSLAEQKMKVPLDS